MTPTERVGLTFPRSGQKLFVNVPPHLVASLRDGRHEPYRSAANPSARSQTVKPTGQGISHAN